MRLLRRHWLRFLVTLVPLVFALLHVVGALQVDVLHRLDNIFYDARLRASMPRTLDPRVVIVDLDEKSLAEAGWPWSRDKLAALVDELFERQQIALLGFDIVFAEEDHSSGLQHLRRLARTQLRDEPGFVREVAALEAALDYDAIFAHALRDRPVVMGYYFTSDREGRISGVLPPPVMPASAAAPLAITTWDGFGASIEALVEAAPLSGFFNAITEADGVVRSLPLLAQHRGQYYESFALALFRAYSGMPTVALGLPPAGVSRDGYRGIDSVVLQEGSHRLQVPVDARVTVLVPFRGPGGPTGGSFRYVSAADVLAGRLPPGDLQGAIVLVGTTAPGLFDLRVTPAGQTFPGVETHANVLSGLLDGRLWVQPDYAVGYEVLVLVLAGLLLACVLPLLTAPRAVLLSLAVLAALVGSNLWLFAAHGLVLPLATAVVMTVVAFGLNMSHGYFVETRSKRLLGRLFGTYVPPELVDEMVRDPDSYSMRATNKVLTVMFCDMRGFTQMSEQMEPIRLQALLNDVFSRLTERIRAHRGTIDKYMGDCVMAFWNAPVDTPAHATLAVRTAWEMVAAVQRINEEHQRRGLPAIGVGIGLNTGSMCVGDMGSDMRRSYTVIGDAVNLGSRLEGLSKVYGVDIVASEATQAQATGFAWQELDRVRVKGKEQAVAIYCPSAPVDMLDAATAAELHAWRAFLENYRSQHWAQCDAQIVALRASNPSKYLYQLYAERVASMRALPHDPGWDGAFNFETK